MLTQDDLQQIGLLFDKKMDEKLEPIHQDIQLVKRDIERVELKVEAVNEYQRKAHTEILEKLFESNEANRRELTQLENRVERLEEHTELTKPHKN